MNQAGGLNGKEVKNTDDVYAAVLAVIKEQIQVFVDREMILKEHHNDSRVIRQEQVYTEAVNKCVKEMDRLMELRAACMQITQKNCLMKRNTCN